MQTPDTTPRPDRWPPYYHPEGRHHAAPLWSRGWRVYEGDDAVAVAWLSTRDEAVEFIGRLVAGTVPPLPDGPCTDGLYRADSGEIVRIHNGRPEPAF